MDNFSRGSWKREGRDAAKEKLIEYFLEQGYGQNFYTPDDLRQIFRELDAVGLLFPSNDSDMIEIYARWREQHHQYWFKKWWGKYRRINSKGSSFFQTNNYLITPDIW